MNWTVQIFVPLLSALVIGGMLIICLRSGSSAAVPSGRREYRIHGAWFVFAAVGGAFLVGIFALASTMAQPEDRNSALWCSAGSAVFFVLFAVLMRSMRVMVDDERVTVRNLFGERSAALREVESVAVVGMMVEVRRKQGPSEKKRQGPLLFLAAFRGLRELMATIRSRAGLPAAPA
jgi:hypothetical protein